MRALDIGGQRFGKWLIIGRRGSANGRSMWLCRCECGEERIVSGPDLSDGSSQSLRTSEPWAFVLRGCL